MKTYLYGMKDSDGMCGTICQTSHKHFMAEQIQLFYKKVGRFQPVEWLIYGEMETKGGEINLYDTPEVFDWEKQLSDDLLSDDSNAIETSEIVEE